MPKGRPKKTIELMRWSPEDGITPEVVRIATNRTRSILHNWRLMDFDITRLLVSAYCQGMHDMATSVIQCGLYSEAPPVLAEFVLDYEI
jgi:hypothetical protein